LKVLIAGGGTAGHINPGIAIAKYIRQKHPDVEILFVGTQKGLETRLVPREGFELKLITVRGFRRKLSIDTLIAVKELFQGILEARRLIRTFQPDIVIGTGGYVCGPVVFNAAGMHIPTFIHEQNAFPGVTNKILSRFVNAVAISFKESDQYFKAAKRLIHTGNPVRSELLKTDRQAARKKLGISPSIPVVVIMGGSRGAGRINETAVKMLRECYQNSDGHVIFATGEAQFEAINGRFTDKKPASLEIVPYIYDAADVYTAADLIICRSGAITLSELQVLGVPSILIPSPNVTANHQEYNARALEKDGGAVVILEKDLNARLLYSQMKELLKDREQLQKMARNARKNGIPNATEKIYEILKDMVKKD
jgi:UDP-N-acetylglucosamine--N-acetylmuramyl-(pentapeptide) pyrophosphoryl-undecaprenol N-acetylglucosamine transferase